MASGPGLAGPEWAAGGQASVVRWSSAHRFAYPAARCSNHRARRGRDPGAARSPGLPRAALSLIQPRAQVLGVRRCESVPVVVEVGVHVGLPAPLSDPARPLLELRRRVVPAAPAARRSGSARTATTRSRRRTETAASGDRRSSARRRGRGAPRTPRARTSSRAGTRSYASPPAAPEPVVEPLVVAVEVLGQLPEHGPEPARIDQGLRAARRSGGSRRRARPAV